MLLTSWILKDKAFKPSFVSLSLIENVGVYFLLYEIATHLH